MPQVPRLRLAVLVLLALASRGAGAAPHPVPEAADRGALFDSLVEAARKYHVFCPQTERNLGFSWESLVPALRAEFVAADTGERLQAALHHLGNSLHDGHCEYTPETRTRTLSAGFDLVPEARGDGQAFFVTRTEDPGNPQAPQPGDILVSFNGLPAGDLARRFHLESNGNNWRNIARDVAVFLTHPVAGLTTVADGDRASWVFLRESPGAAPATVRVETVYRFPAESAKAANDPTFIDYQSQSCDGLPDRAYGPYRLAGRERTFCVYRSDRAPFDRYPVVRHFTFLVATNDSWDAARVSSRVRGDRDALARLLAEGPAPRGVILDLRDNHGGNNPNWFLDWYAPREYRDAQVRFRLHEDFASEQALERAGIRGARATYYREALAQRQAGQAFAPPVAFFCRPEGCEWDGRYTPSHQVSRAPLALLVGPECGSSCDRIARLFADNRFGPLVGEPTAAAYTAFRLRHEVKAPKTGVTLGTIRFAFSTEVSGQTGTDLEAVPIPVDVPVARTRENRDSYDRLLVDEAIRALSRR